MDGLGLDAVEIERRLADLSDSEVQSGASHYTELYFEPVKRDDDQPLVILHHVRKTAGTSLRSVMKANYSGGQRSLVGHLGYSKDMADLGHSKKAYLTRSRLLELHQELWRRLAPHERRSLRYVASHEANFLRPFVDRPTIVVSLIRWPVERVLSAYYFKNRSTSHGTKTLDAVYSGVGEGRPTKKLYLFNGQARSLLEPFYDTSSLQLTAGPSDDADLWRERLFALVNDVYLLGISERFDEFVSVLSGRLGWREKFSPRIKVNTERPPAEAIAPDVLRAITEYNWLDLELYERQLARFSAASRQN